MPARKQKSFAITVRPLDGIPEGGKLEKALLSWARKQQYAVVVAEKSEKERHFHIQVWYDEPKTLGNARVPMQRILLRCVPDYDEACKRVMSKGVKWAYSDWYLSYLLHNEDKEDDPSVELYSKIPVDTSSYYPTEEEQEAFQAKAKAVDPKYANLALLYRDWAVEAKPPRVHYFECMKCLHDLMFVSKQIRVMKDPKTIRTTAKLLSMYLRANIKDMSDLLSADETAKFAEYRELEAMRAARNATSD